MLLQGIISRKVQTIKSMSAFSQYRRKDSAIRTLVAETLVLAKTHGYVEKIENELEEELQRDNTDPPQESIARWRRHGEKIFKSKSMLLAVVILCVTDCALVLGELILDLHNVKVTLDETDDLTNNTRYFLSVVGRMYNMDLRNMNSDKAFDLILNAMLDCNATLDGVFNSSLHRIKRSLRNVSDVILRNDSQKNSEHFNYAPDDSHSIQEIIAHSFHLSSMAILAIILLETLLKALSAGYPFLHRKLEVFDAFIVIVSFSVDLVLLFVVPKYDTRDFVFILAFLLPWRVIRVVNSLVVAVKDHEHFRLKLVYSRKKKIQHSLRETEVKLQILRYQCNAIKRLCIEEGLDEWKLDQCLRAEEQLASLAVKRKSKLKLYDSVVFTPSERDNSSCHSSRNSPRTSIPSIDNSRVPNGHGLRNGQPNGDIEERDEG